MRSDNLEIFIAAINKLKGIELGSYRKTFLLRRLNYRIKLTDTEDIFGYLELLKRDEKEFRNFLDVLSINVSEFFRDQEVFDYFRKRCLKQIIERKKFLHGSTVRIWSAGCAQGQEPYSLALVLKQELKSEKNLKAQVIATDIDNNTLKKAEAAEYNLRSLKNIKRAVLEKYFTVLDGELFRLNAEIRQIVKFQQLDLINSPVKSHLNAIFCRNVMIYLNRPQQEALLLRLYDSLTAGGFLVIGKAEVIWGS